MSLLLLRVIGAVALLSVMCSANLESLSITDQLGERVIDSYTINQGYLFTLTCGIDVGADSIAWSYSNGTEVRNLTMFANSSFTISKDGRRNISEGVSLLDFRRLYHTNTTQVANLTSYMYMGNRIEFIRPDSSIAGTYTCTLNEFESLNVSVNVRIPNGSFSQFFIRFNRRLSDVSNVNDKDYQTAVLEADLFSQLVVNGSNVSSDPIRTMSCYTVPPNVSQVNDETLDRIECNIREYPNNSLFVEELSSVFNVALSRFELVISERGFCNYSQTTSSTFGFHIWPETIGGRTFTIPCNRNNPDVVISRTCQTNGNGWLDPDYSQCLRGVTGVVAIVDRINNMNVGDSYSINEGYQLALSCVASESQTEPRWISSNEREVQDVTEFMNSSFTNIGSRRNLNDGLSVRDFRGLYSSRAFNENLQGIFLISYINQRRPTDFILPNSSIGGTYTCRSGNNAISVSINVRSPSGAFSQFFVRFSCNLSSVSDVTDRDYQLAIIEANIFNEAVIAGFNSTQDPIRTISCQFVPQQQGSELDRIECDIREYPPNGSFVEVVGHNVSSFLSGGIFHSINTSSSGFCNYSQTTSSEYGDRMWSEAAVGEVSRMSCTGRFITRICRSDGWSSPDYGQCRRESGPAGAFIIIDINGVIVNDSYSINQGYYIVLLCGGSQTQSQWIGSDGNKVQSITTFLNSSFTLTNDGERKLNEGLSVHDFRRQLFSYSFNESDNVQYLISYIDFQQRSDFILPDSSIAGTYTCTSGNQSQAVSINLRSPRGEFSQFFFRMTAFLSNISITDVDDRDYKLAVLEATIFNAAVIGGFNSTRDPIRTISCQLVPHPQSDSGYDRVECDLREYPPNGSFVEVVWQNVNLILADAGDEVQQIQMSVTGFCNHSQTTSLDYGNHTWPESVGDSTLVVPCSTNCPGMNVIRVCQTNGRGWRNPDYSQCVVCPCENETIVTDRGTFEWPVTSTENTSSLTCPHGPTGASATRLCRSNGVWDSAIITNCANPRITNEFTDLANTNVTVDNVVAVAQNLSDLVDMANERGDQNQDNLRNVSSLLAQTATLISIPTVIVTLSPEEVAMTTESTIEILDSVQDWPPQVVGTQSNNIVQSFERIVNALISQENFTNLTIIQTNIAFQGLRVQRTDFNGVTLIGSSSNVSLSIETLVNSESVTLQKFDLATITLPDSISNITTEDDINLAFTLYNQSTLFPIREPPPDTVVGSSIISASVGGIPDGTTLPDVVTVNLRITAENASNFRCVYWNFTAANGQGDWSTDGCTTVYDRDDTDNVTCLCNHLTNFACLVDINARNGGPPPPPAVTVALEIVTYIGVSLSLLGLILTIITLLIFKSLRQRDASKFHIQLCLSLILMLIVFVVGIDRVSVRAGCITVGVLIHYFALVSWMWMGAEAVLMFQKLVIVFSNITWKHHLIVSIICWGLPLLPVVIALSVDVDHYITFYDNTNNEEGFCFLGQLSVFLTAFLVPVLLILIFNLIVYILVLRVLILHTWKKNKRQGKTGLTPLETIKMLMSFSGIIVLFGLTWVFAVFTFISEPGVSYTIQFFFAFFNAFQGFFIFIFFVILSSDSRAAWKSLLCPWLNKNEQETSKYNLSSNKKATSKTNTSSYVSNPYSSKGDTMNEVSENENEYISMPPSLAKEKEKARDGYDDLDMIPLKGARVTRRSTRKHTRHIEEVKLDFFDSDNEYDYENEF